MLQVKRVSAAYNGNPIIRDLNFSVKDHQVVSFIGPNGCGKSTLFRCLKGEKDLGSGNVAWMEGVLPKHASVEQRYRETLLPWQTVKANICFPLTIQRLSIREREDRLEELISELSIELPLSAKAGQLSGGQAQLTVLLRALLFRPKVLFLDEPFSALDYHTKWLVREFLYKCIQRQNITTFMISHDPEDCVFLSDKVLVLKARPTTLLESISIDLSKSRTFDLIGDVQFMQLQHEIVIAAYGGGERVKGQIALPKTA